MQQTVGLSEIADRQKGSSVKQIQVGQKAIGRYEKGNLQQQREGTFQGIIRLVAVLSVIGLHHHEPLVALEYLFDMVDAGFQFYQPHPFFLLHGVRPAVERQHKQVDRDTQGNDGDADMHCRRVKE